ncbi:DNA repair endonuclease XPF X2, partial [Biomphalaria glabrata]
QLTYAQGGVLFITSRILVVDLLTDEFRSNMSLASWPIKLTTNKCLVLIRTGWSSANVLNAE